jgi:hypothetical protein
MSQRIRTAEQNAEADLCFCMRAELSRVGPDVGIATVEGRSQKRGRSRGLKGKRRGSWRCRNGVKHSDVVVSDIVEGLKGFPVVVFGGQMIRSRLLHHARRLSTSPSTNSHSRLRLSTLAFITTTGVLVSSYFLWPSKYRGSPTFSHRPLSPSYFIPVTISENSQVGPDLAVLTLSVPPDSRPPDENDPSLDPIWSIFIKDDDIQVERPYTPLFGIDEGVIKLWVKRYPRGEVGRWLHSKQPGDTIEIRGPLKTFPFREGEWDEVVMVCMSLFSTCHYFS